MLHTRNAAKAHNYRVRFFFHKTTALTHTMYFSRFGESGSGESGINHVHSKVQYSA